MEKYGDDQYHIYWQNDDCLMRLPGGQVINYDKRFGFIAKGEERFIPNEK